MPKNNSCPRSSLSRGFRRVELAENVELRRRREVEQLLELRHVVDLAATVQNTCALFDGVFRLAVEIGGALLELGEVLDRFQRPLRSEQPLDVDTAQRRRVDAVAMLIRADIADGVCRGVGVAVGMAVEARDALAGDQRAAVLGGIELLLRERREEQAQAFQLLGIQDALEKLLEIRERHELALGYVAQVGPRGQKDRRGELGQQDAAENRSPGRTA